MKILICSFLFVMFSGCGIVGDYHKEFSDEQENISNSQNDRYKLYKDRFDEFRDG